MHVFLTGASGFVGSAIGQELLRAGHQVTGLVRSEASARVLIEAGASPFMGSLDDLDGLKRGADAADGVIHTAFIHDFANYAAAAETDRRAIEALGSTLAGSGRPLLVTGGLLGIQPGQSALITEDDRAAPEGRVSETTALTFTESGVRTVVIRLPPSVHDRNDYGFVPTLINLAREKGESAYIGDGNNRWPAVHRLDAARLFRLALEAGTAGSLYNAVDDQGIPFRELAEVIGRHLNLPVVATSPEQATAHFGWMSRFAAMDSPASSDQTRAKLGWQPTHSGLLDDLATGDYFAQK